jgi:pimeloyl-ACP methyl ester carboxylesterase
VIGVRVVAIRVDDSDRQSEVRRGHVYEHRITKRLPARRPKRSLTPHSSRSPRDYPRATLASKTASQYGEPVGLGTIHGATMSRRASITVGISMFLSSVATAQSPRLELTPCTLPGVAADAGARCGTLTVHENRATRRGRTIGLRVVVFPATGPSRKDDPIFFIAGGPGSSVVDDEAAFIALDSAGLRAQRDLVLVDQRGTGGSAPLICQFYGPPDSLQSFLGDFMPPAGVRRCRETYAKRADVTQYTTTIAVEDLDDVRAALGARQINLTGGSYGTRAAQEYMRRHPDRVRTATLFGLVPPSERMPQHFARDAQNSLDAVVAECAADTACRTAFPRLADDIRAVFDGLTRAPARVTVEHPGTKQPVTVTLSRDMVAETLRYMLYRSAGASLVPAAMHQAATGDFTWLARRSLRARWAGGKGTFDGLYVAITCMEDVPMTDAAREAVEARGTFLGDYRMRNQRAACEAWGRAPVPADFVTPVSSKAPVLLVTGAYDPVTPPRNAVEVARTLPNSLTIVVPSGGHGLDGLDGLACIDRIQREVIERGSVAGIDTSCVSKIRRPEFPTVLPR